MEERVWREDELLRDPATVVQGPEWELEDDVLPTSKRPSQGAPCAAKGIRARGSQPG